MGEWNVMEIMLMLALYFVPFLFSLSFHEFAHGWMAKRKGDNTADLMGRLTLNPMAHADLWGTFILPLASIFMRVGMNVSVGFFGWAKPVPVNTRNLKNPKNDMFWIALAGPASNMFLAIIASLIYILMVSAISPEGNNKLYADFLFSFVRINLLLCFFNLLPLHPLDGGKILERFLPYKANQFLENNMLLLNGILIVGLMLGFFRFLAYPGLIVTHALGIYSAPYGW
jgi:Zn-dependent protease